MFITYLLYIFNKRMWTNYRNIHLFIFI